MLEEGGRVLVEGKMLEEEGRVLVEGGVGSNSMERKVRQNLRMEIEKMRKNEIKTCLLTL